MVCERMWWLHYEARLTLKEDKEHRLRGTLIHLAMAYYFASKMDPPPAWFHEKDLNTALEEKGAGLPDGIRKAKEVLVAYMHTYPDDDLQPYTVEQQFTATLGELDPGGPHPELDNEVISCRPDLIARSGGILNIWDSKSARAGWSKRGEPGRLERWSDKGPWALDWQSLVNLHIVRRRLSEPVQSFIIQRLKREPPYDFDRHVLKIPPRPYELAPRVAREAVYREIQIREKVKKGIAPTPSFWACYGRYGPCDYRDLCMAKAETQDEVRRALYVEDHE